MSCFICEYCKCHCDSDHVGCYPHPSNKLAIICESCEPILYDEEPSDERGFED